MNKIEKALQQAGKPGFWGQIQIDYQDGKPVVVRLTSTDKIYDEENNSHGRQYK